MFLVELLNEYFRQLSLLGIVCVLLFIAGHRILLGVHYPGLGKDEKDIVCFTIWERLIHLVTLVSFMTLAVTGFWAVIVLHSRLTGWLYYTHILAAGVFASGLIAVAVRWAEDCRFVFCDWQWAKMFGGYLWFKGEVPAEKFNGGQKAFFWAILCLSILCMLSGVARIFPMILAQQQDIIYLIHCYSSLLLIIFVLAHIYLGTLANPGTWQVLLTGKVSGAGHFCIIPYGSISPETGWSNLDGKNA